MKKPDPQKIIEVNKKIFPKLKQILETLYLNGINPFHYVKAYIERAELEYKKEKAAQFLMRGTPDQAKNKEDLQ